MIKRFFEAADPLHWEESVEVVRTPDKDAPWAPPFIVVPGTAMLVEAPGSTQDLLQGLYLESAGI